MPHFKLSIIVFECITRISKFCCMQVCFAAAHYNLQRNALKHVVAITQLYDRNIFSKILTMYGRCMSYIVIYFCNRLLMISKKIRLKKKYFLLQYELCVYAMCILLALSCNKIYVPLLMYKNSRHCISTHLSKYSSKASYF